MATGSQPMTGGKPAPVPVPGHLWAVGLFGLLWNGFAVVDYYVSNFEGDLHFRRMGMTEAQVAYMEAMPAWLNMVWATGVWSALAATVLLIARKRLAAPAFLVSLLCFGVSLGHALLALGGGLLTSVPGWLQLIVLALAVAFFAYARAMARANVLR